MKHVWLLGVAPVILASTLAMQRQPQTAARPVPLKVGERIPDFRAVDQSGKERRFGDLVGQKGLVLFFYKSADW